MDTEFLVATHPKVKQTNKKKSIVLLYIGLY